MTTQAEIRRWVNPFMALYPAMVQERRLLLFTPVSHMLRAVVFWGGRSRLNPNPGWMLCPLFIPQGLIRTFGRDIPVGFSDWPGFKEMLDERVGDAIRQYLVPGDTVQHFYDVGMDPAAFFEGDLTYFPAQRAVVLAALGRFDEAEALLAPAVDQYETTGQARIDLQRAVDEGRYKLRRGDVVIGGGEECLRLAASLRPLSAALTARSAGDVAALLHQWEAASVGNWGIEKYWQPTPFPFEVA